MRELMAFSGTLQRDALVGTVVTKDAEKEDAIGKTERVRMKRMKLLAKPESMEKWAAALRQET
jgi:hypothetical protein